MSEISQNTLLHPPIFVCGVQRAGTTLLVKMLSRNQQVKFLPQETHVYPLLWKPGNKLNQFESCANLADHLLQKLPEVNYGWTTAMSFLEEITDEVRNLPAMPKDTADLLRVILHKWQQKQEESVITGEKTPAHIYYALETLKEFPECKLVLMCRDPRAAALSEHIKLKNNTRVARKFNAFNFIVRWSTATDLIKKLGRRDNVHFLKYEDLIQNPEKSIRAVTDFLQIEYSGNMLDVGVTNSSFGDKNQKNISFNQDNLVRWKTELPERTIAMIEKHLGTQMKEFGYDLSSTQSISVPASQILKLKIARLASKWFPAYFHHMNRNKKYRS